MERLRMVDWWTCNVRFPPTDSTALAVGGERRREGLEAGATRGVALSQDHGVLNPM
jgi:hypothetical protein